MDKLKELKISETPLVRDLPVSIGEASLSSISRPAIYHLQSKLKPSQIKITKAGEEVWYGLGQALFFAKNAPSRGVDVSDGWVFFALSGESRMQVLSHLVPIDLDQMPVESSARTQLGHMMTLLMKREDHIEIGAMSSYAKFAKNEIIHVMQMTSKIDRK